MGKKPKTEPAPPAARRQIVQYPLDAMDGPQTLFMQLGARIIGAGARIDQPALWAIEFEGPLSLFPRGPRTFQLVRNGEPMANLFADDYLGTITGHGYCYHVFEVRP